MSATELKRPQETETGSEQPIKRFRQDTQPSLKRGRSTSPPPERNPKRPPIIPLQPLQRLDLFKKRQRWRMSSIYAARNSSAAGSHPKQLTAAPSKEPVRYGDIGVQTDYVPDLKSRTLNTKEKAQEEAEKKVTGVFSGQLLYDTNQIDENNKSPVKFPKRRSGSLDVSDGNINSLLVSKKHVQTTKPDITEALTLTKDPDGPKINLGPSAGFNFLSKAEKESNTGSVPPLTSKGLDLNKTSAPSFSLPNTEDTTKPTSDSIFGAKKQTGDKLSFNISQPVESEAKKFSFGSSTEKPSLFGSSSASDTKEDAKAPTLSSGSKTIEDKPSEISVPSFKFGAPEKTEKKPITFGASETESKPSTTPAFSFGAEETAKPKAPALSFGTSTSEKKDETAKQSLFGSLSSTNGEKDDAAKPSLFGASEKAAFNFGSSTNTETKFSGGFSFGSTTEKKDEKPSTVPFSFGSSSTEKRGDKPAASLFSFGATANKPDEKVSTGSLLGSTTSDKNKIPSAPFTFGATTDKKDDKPSAPSFSFGSVPAKDTEKPASSFKFEATTEKADKASAPSFSFGSAPNGAKPIFGSTAGAATTTTGNGFSFGSSTTNKETASTGFNFGSTDSADKAAGSLGGTAPKTSLFGSAAQTPMFGSDGSQSNKPTIFSGMENKPTIGFGAATSTPAAEKTAGSGLGFGFGASKPADNKPSFNFGGSSQPQNPASVFSATPSGFSFGQTSTPNPTSAFGQAPTTSAFGFNANSTPALGQIQPQTSSAFGGFGVPKGPVNISFAGGDADPASVFGGNNATPAGGFGFGAPGATGTPSFGAPGAPGTPTAAGARVPGRKIAQMRSRRR